MATDREPFLQMRNDGNAHLTESQLFSKMAKTPAKSDLVGGLEHFFFSPIYWEESSQLTNIFQRGWNHQPVMLYVN